MLPGDPIHLQTLANSIYVVLIKDREGHLTLVAEPGLQRPWSSKNKKFADFIAHEADGMAATWREAFTLLLKENPMFEKQLHERIARNAHMLTDKIIVDATGKPVGKQIADTGNSGGVSDSGRPSS